MKKFYCVLSKIALSFVTLYAVLGIFDFIVLQTGVLDRSMPELLNILLLAPTILLFYSWPFFLPVSSALLLTKHIIYKRLKPTDKKSYIRNMVLHIVLTLIGMAGIFYVYYDKFGLPSI